MIQLLQLMKESEHGSNAHLPMAMCQLDSHQNDVVLACLTLFIFVFFLYDVDLGLKFAHCWLVAGNGAPESVPA